MNKLMITFLSINFLFLSSAGLLLGFCLVSEQQERGVKNISSVAFDILLFQCPLTAGVVNAVIMFLTFLLSLPALALPTNRGWLKLQGWLLVFCSFFTLVLGLFIWFDTLQTRKNLAVIWGQQPSDIQGLLQQRFQCCGYLDSMTPPFIVDNVCPDSFTASQKMGCVGPFSTFANNYLDLIFTAAFGIVGIDVLLLLAVVMVLKYRAELERYRHIDEKLGF
ncbi:putative dihydroxy-acid dehydratase [Venturia nashicola]|uniref:Putative dihydroxy-acid dehydratase n=1 Tax=Venturia nashicola TaxID=86259 RepID=A0A4Z1NJU4_9PEZI|nr:putative dihydroxy-acid dehydratase [Venturia nashicola]TLD23424.1 putative dihydroxy-acid dehydratase [Venturia nashicola]